MKRWFRRLWWALTAPTVEHGRCTTCGKAWAEIMAHAVWGAEVAFPPEADQEHAANLAKHVGRRRAWLGARTHAGGSAADQREAEEFFGPACPGHLTFSMEMPEPKPEEKP